MASGGEVVIFIDTNIDTRIALAVSPDITAADLKREVERNHSSIFPQLEEIEVHGLMVRRKSCFYHLTGSLPIKYAFQGLKGTWFLHVEIHPSTDTDKPGLSHSVAAKNGNHFSDGSNINDYFVPNTKNNDIHNRSNKRIKGIISIKCLGKELWKTAHNFSKKCKKKKVIHLEHRLSNNEKECPIVIKGTSKSAENGSIQMSRNKVKPVIGSSSPMVQTPTERSPEVLSKRGILDIERNSSELNSVSRCYDSQNCKVASIAIESGLEKQLIGRRNNNESNIQANSLPQFASRTPPRTLPWALLTDPGPGSLGNKLEKMATVGKRVLTAGRNLRPSGNKQRPGMSFRRFKAASNLPFFPRISVFEISD